MIFEHLNIINTTFELRVISVDLMAAARTEYKMPRWCRYRLCICVWSTSATAPNANRQIQEIELYPFKTFQLKKLGRLIHIFVSGSCIPEVGQRQRIFFLGLIQNWIYLFLNTAFYSRCRKKKTYDNFQVKYFTTCI